MTISKSKSIKHNGSKLFVFEKDQNFSFLGKRLFIIFGKRGQTRGMHAHRKHKQYLICVNGECEVTLDNGYEIKKVILKSPEIGIEIKAMTWSKQVYKKKDTKILVLCDQTFKERDYIRDYLIFKKIINEKKKRKT